MRKLRSTSKPERKIRAGEIGAHSPYWSEVLGDGRVAEILQSKAKSGELEAELSARPFRPEEADLHIL
ncbi:MAG: hypothetical protein ACLQKY_04145 [Terracidiphilus sp.]